MAHSLSHSFAAQTAGSFVHAASGTKFSIAVTGESSHMSQSMVRGTLSASYPVQYILGSGSHAYGYLAVFNGYLFQSPVSYYTRQRKWDMAPGYETNPKPAFDRPVTLECVVCHSGHANSVPGTINGYQPIAFSDEAITCDRCHGDPSAHLQHPDKHNIINPAKLPPRARDSVCEQCHLNGEARVLNPKRSFSDFQPGHDLEEFFSVYVRAAEGASAQLAALKVVSHAEQLRLSACARQSESKLWCGTCHNPHEKATNPIVYFKTRCLSCHGEAILKTHKGPVDNCIGCHMAKRKAWDGAHTSFTDHRISRFPAADSGQTAAPGPVTRLAAWHDPPTQFVLRNLGLANLALAERTQSSELSDEGAQQLIQAMKVVADDPVILSKLGVVLLRKGMLPEAIETDELAVHLDPNVAGYHANLGITYKEAGQTDKAIAELEAAIRLDRGMAISYQALADIYESQGKKAEAAQTIKRLHAVLPNLLPGEAQTSSK